MTDPLTKPSSLGIHRLRITVLMEHRTAREGLATEHGFSLWLEADETRILFDTGQSPAFAENAHRLGIDLARTDFIVLSHGHYDHSGGLETALRLAPRAQVCLHPQAGIPRYSHPPGLPLRRIGMPLESWKALQPRLEEARLCQGPLQIRPGVWLTGPVAKIHPVEHPQEAFSLDEAGLDPDRFLDDLALVMKTPAGHLLFTGCCHSGVENTLLAAEALIGSDRCLCLVGGLHLVRSEEARIEGVLESLRRHRVQAVLAGHCTGSIAEGILGSLRRQTGAGPLKGLLEVGSTWELDLQTGDFDVVRLATRDSPLP